jgi:hypothetical protein
MNFLNSKYRRRLIGILISIYLVSLVAGIFHFHHIGISNNDSIESEKNIFSNHFQNLTGNNYECIIQQNLTSLQTTLISVFDDHQLITDAKIFLKCSTPQFYVFQFHRSNNHLRAPPYLS